MKIPNPGPECPTELITKVISLQCQVRAEGAVREPATRTLPSHGPGASPHPQGGYRVRGSSDIY